MTNVLLPSVILTNVAVMATYLLGGDYETRSTFRLNFLVFMDVSAMLLEGLVVSTGSSDVVDLETSSLM